MYTHLMNSGQLVLLRDASISLLEANDLSLVQESKTLFQCLSTLLYQTDIFAYQIQALCLQHFRENHKLVAKEISTFASYIMNPQAEQFDFLNLELISQIFKVKLELYYLEDGLFSIIINHGFTKTLRFFKEDYNYYELQTQQYKKKFKFVKKIVDQLINSFLQITPNTYPKRPLSVEESQKNHPTLDVIYNMNDLGVQSVSSAQTFKFQKPITQTLTPQIQKMITQVTPQLSAKLPYGNITSISTQKKNKPTRVFDYSEEGVKKVVEQRKEEEDETNFLKEIMHPSPSTQQSSSQQIIATQSERVIGKLKFYDENKQYGFFIDDVNKKDIFVHWDDFNRSGVDPEHYKKKKKGFLPYFSYQVILYQGKVKQNIKAIDIKFEKYEPINK